MSALMKVLERFYGHERTISKAGHEALAPLYTSTTDFGGLTFRDFIDTMPTLERQTKFGMIQPEHMGKLRAAMSIFGVNVEMTFFISYLKLISKVDVYVIDLCSFTGTYSSIVDHSKEEDWPDIRPSIKNKRSFFLLISYDMHQRFMYYSFSKETATWMDPDGKWDTNDRVLKGLVKSIKEILGMNGLYIEKDVFPHLDIQAEAEKTTTDAGGYSVSRDLLGYCVYATFFMVESKLRNPSATFKDLFSSAKALFKKHDGIYFRRYFYYLNGLIYRVIINTLPYMTTALNPILALGEYREGCVIATILRDEHLVGAVLTHKPLGIIQQYMSYYVNPLKIATEMLGKAPTIVMNFDNDTMNSHKGEYFITVQDGNAVRMALNYDVNLMCLRSRIRVDYWKTIALVKWIHENQKAPPPPPKERINPYVRAGRDEGILAAIAPARVKETRRRAAPERLKLPKI